MTGRRSFGPLPSLAPCSTSRIRGDCPARAVPWQSTTVSGEYSVEADFLILASGTSEAYGSLFKLLANPGDEILVPVPGYPLLEVLTELESVRQVPYRLIYEEPRGWRIDMERLRNTISNRTVAIVSVSPNNPTGSFLKNDELARDRRAVPPVRAGTHRG